MPLHADQKEGPTWALDASLWDEPTTGIGLYTRELWSAFQALGVRVERWGARVSGELPRHTASRTLYALGELPEVLRHRTPDVFHAVANFNLPLVRPPSTRFVLTLHDVIPLLLRESVSSAFRWQFQLWLSRSLKLAEHVLCVSETTRRDVLGLFPEAWPKLQVVHNGVDHVHRIPRPNRTEEEVLRTLDVPEQYVLYAGALEARKNVDLVLEACARLHRAGLGVPLLLVGQRWFGAGRAERRIGELQREGVDIRPLGFQPDALFYELIRRATVFVFPSHYEGFGLPPLEAMALGVPTVVSNAGSLPEVCGGGARYVSPQDSEGLARTLRELLTHPEERKRLAAEGTARAKAFTWKKAAEATLAAYSPGA